MKYIARFVMWLGGWKYKGELPDREESSDYIGASYFKLGFCVGRAGIFKSAYPGFYFDEKRIFLFSVGYSSSCFAGYSGGPGKKR